MEEPPIRTLSGGPVPPGAGRPRWIPLAIAAAGVVSVVTLLGVIGSEPKATSPDTTRTAPHPADVPATTPRSLAATVPELGTEMLRVAYVAPDSERTRVADWAAISPHPVEVENGPGWDGRGAFAPTRGTFAAHSTADGLTVDHIAVDAAVSSWAWHTERADIAWVAQPPGTTDLVLYRTTTVPYLDRGAIDEVTRFPRDGGSLVTWGDWGYVVNHPRPGTRVDGLTDPVALAGGASHRLVMTIHHDPDGAPTLAVPGEVVAAGNGGEVLVETATEHYAVARDAGHTADDLAMGATVTGLDQGPTIVLHPDGHTVPIDLPPAEGRQRLLVDDGSTVITVEVDGVADIESHTVDGSGHPPRRVADVDRMLGVAGDDRWLLMAADHSGEIVLHDWETGVTHRVPFDLGRVTAVGW